MDEPNRSTAIERPDTETRRLTICQNSDNQFLLPSGSERAVVGHVDEVNGAGAAEIAGYVPTKHELAELVKYWTGRILENSWFFFVYGGTGSSEVRLKAFAQRRIARAAAVIGDEAVEKAIAERFRLETSVASSHNPKDYS